MATETLWIDGTLRMGEVKNGGNGLWEMFELSDISCSFSAE